MYHGILIDQEFKDGSFPKKFKQFAKKQDGSWRIYGIEIENDQLEDVIKEIQENMKEGTWYVHFYNEERIIVIFKNKVFKTNKDSLNQIIDYGKQLKIPKEQLDFYPNNFQNEKDYFKV